jgi:UDP-glucose 4-epimerase
MEGARADQAYEVAVVGHRGFLGGTVFRILADAGISVRGYGSGDPLHEEGRPSRDLESVRTVVWCAGRANPRLALENPALAAEDVTNLAEALDALMTLPMAPRIVLLSSGGTVYGPPAVPPFKETDAPAPVNAYGLAKLAQERVLDAWPGTAVALRVANAYGPGQVAAPGQGVVAHWIASARAGSAITLYGDPESTRDYVYVDDVARAVQAVHRIEDDLPSVVNIGSGEATTLSQLMDAFGAAIAPVAIEVVCEEARSTDATHSVLDVSLAREALGWAPTVDLVEGMRAQWEAALR